MATSAATPVSLLSLLSEIQISTPPAIPPASSQEVELHGRCKALTQDPRTKQHTGHRCRFRKTFDNTKPQELKTMEDLVADELCGQHKKIKERFIDMIIPQIKDHLHPVASLSATAVAQQCPRLSIASVQQHPQLSTAAGSAAVARQQPRLSTTAAVQQHHQVAKQKYDTVQIAAGHASASNDAKVPNPSKGKAPEIQLSSNSKSVLKQCMNLILAHSTEITLGGASQPYHEIAAKAITIQKLAFETNKVLDTIGVDDGEESILKEEVRVNISEDGDEWDNWDW